MAPRLRDDLVATIIEEDGVTCVEVTDPSSSASFRFYDFEYALAQELNGQPLEAVVAWASRTYGVELGPEALDAFIEKLAGLGFLVGAGAGAQPAVVVPSSPSSSAHAFAELATTVAGGAPALLDVPGVEAFAAEIAESVVDDEATVLPATARPAAVQPATFLSGVPAFVDAVAPEGLISGDATEYRLKDTAASGLWERASAAAAVSAPAASTRQNATPGPRESERAPAGLQVLGGPLPPPAPSGRADAPDAPAESPLSAITHVMSVETSGPAPVGALDAAAGSGSGRVVPVFPSFPVTAGLAARPLISPLPDAAKPLASPLPAVGPVVAGPPAPATEQLESPSRWAAELVDEVDRAAAPPPERKQATRPELIVMPPTPVPLGADPSVAVPLPPRRSAAVVVLLLLAGAAAGAVWFLRPTAEPTTPAVVASAPLVHVVSPQPTTFYRWFETVGTVSAGRDDTLSFAKAGRLQDAMAPGTTFAAGEVIARLKGVGVREQLANKVRSRVAYLEQLRESSRASGDAAVRQAEAKLTAKRKELAEAQTWQSELEIRAKVAGEIAQLLVAKGAFVPAGAPVFHVRAAGPQATFPLTTDDVARVRGLGFCRVETVPGTARPGDGATPEAGSRAIDCALATPAAGDARLVVDLTNAGAVTPGTQVRLASARYDAVFPVPRAAVVRQGETDRVWIAAGGGRAANSRPIETAATIDDLALISRGLSVGDAVIVDPPGTLKDGAEINVAR